MEGSTWQDNMDNVSWTGMGNGGSDMANNWSAMAAWDGVGGGGGGSVDPWNVSGGGGSVDLWNVSGGGGSGGGSDWQEMQVTWTDPVAGFERGNTWGVPDDWGIEPPSGGAYPPNMMMDASGYAAMSNMFDSDIGNFNGCSAGDFMGGGGGADVGAGVGVMGDGGGGGGGSGCVGPGGLESDLIDFDIDGLLSGVGQDTAAAACLFGMGAAGGVGGGVGSGAGMAGGADYGSPWCPVMAYPYI